MVPVRFRQVASALFGAAGLCAALGTTYLVVACQALPSFMGRVAGDNRPRTKLGAALLAVAAAVAVAGAVTARRGRRAG